VQVAGVQLADRVRDELGVDVGADDERPVVGQPVRDRAADPPPGAGDDGYLAPQRRRFERGVDR